MKLALKRPVQILIIGAGGTGGYVIPHLYRIAFASDRKCRIIIADGDIVEDKNLVRQSFSSLDVGENKATVMAERYSDVFGIETEYIPDFIEDEEQLYNLLNYEYPYYTSKPKPLPILIGAVDNNRSRVMCHEVFKKMDNIIDKAVKSTGAESGRGSLIKKAGLASGATATSNSIFKEMEKVRDRLVSLQDRYSNREDYWWGVFTNLESMMSDLNSQSQYMSGFMM